MLARILGSATLAAALAAVAPAWLALYLNERVDILAEAPSLFTALVAPYWLALTLIFFLVALLLQRTAFGRDVRQAPVPGLPGFATLALLAAALVCDWSWDNLLQYRHSLPAETVRALALASVAVTAAGLVLLGLCLDTLFFPARRRGLSAPLLVLSSSALAIVPLGLRPAPAAAVRHTPVVTAPAEPLRRVILVGMDGLGPSIIEDGVAHGRLPALAALAQKGAYGPLATLRPTAAPPIWTTLVTGVLPRDHGVRGFVRYRLIGSATEYELLPTRVLVGLLEKGRLVQASPITNVARRRRALWNALNAFGIEAGVVRLWGTHPVEKVRGFMLSNYFYLLPRERIAEALQPTTLAREVEAKVTEPEDVDRSLVAEFVDPAVEIPGDRVPWRRDLVERALAPDLTTLRAAQVLRSAFDPPFLAVYFYGFDVVGHSFLRFAEPERFGDVSADERRKYGRVVDRYASFLSQIVGDYAGGLRHDEILIVVSGYGMEPVSPWRRLAAALTGAGGLGGSHADAPDGFVLAVGDGIRPGARFERASVLDVTPTILYLMGLPVARDMEGRVATEILDEDFARAHPVTYVPSYESLAVTPLVKPAASDLPPLLDEEP